MRLNLLAFSVVAGLGLVQAASAAEGMWVPQKMKKIAGAVLWVGLMMRS